MTIALPANRLLLGFFLPALALLTACEVGNRPLLTDTTPTEARDLASFGLLNAPNTPNRDGEVILSHNFLNVSGNRISTEGFTDFDTPATVCTIDGCVAQADAGTTGNGYAYFIANDANGNAAYSYAGILASTNLGEPLRTFSAPVASWRGEWSLNGVGPDTADEDDDFVLRIDFGRRQLGGSGTKIINGVQHDLIVSGSSVQPIYYNDAGVILNGQADLVRSNVVYQGFLIGLIGSEGAVGAFRSADPDLSYSGGFIVTPPTR